MNGPLLFLCAALLVAFGVAVVFCIRELGARRRAESDLGRVKHEVEQRRHDYLRAFAHDLRNPLSAIVMVSDLLQEEEDPELLRTQLRRVKEQASGMVDLITHYVELSALDAGRYPVGRISLDLNALLQERLAEWAGRGARKGQTLFFEGGEDGLSVQGDPDACTRVIDQVLDNAVKFAPKGSRIRAAVQRHSDWGEICVWDEGPGFKEEDHRRLFQPCTPLSARPTGGESAVGLGLCIAKRLMDLTGGRIEVPVGRGPVKLYWPR